MMQSISVAGSIDDQSDIRSIQLPQRKSRLHPLSLHPLHQKLRSPHALDTKSEKPSPKKYLAYLTKNKKKRSYLSQRERSRQTNRYQKYVHNHNTLTSESAVKKKAIRPNKSSQKNETYVQRYEEQKQALTVLSIRFASDDTHDNITNREEAYIKAQKEDEATQNQKQQNQKLPYLKYRKFLSPEEQLKEMGYSSDTRLASEIYSDKVEEKKNRYVNKMEALKRQLEGGSGVYSNNGGNNVDARRERIQKSKIQVKILGEQIRRNRQRELIKVEERKGKKMLQSLLKGMD